MVVELFVRLLVTLFAFIGTLFPSVTLPGWVGAFSGHVATVSGQMAPLGHWLPFSALAQGIVFVQVAVSAAVIIRLVRIILSLLTAGGGSAA